MRKSHIFLFAFLLVAAPLYSQREGIKKGERELNFNGNISHTTYGEGEFATSFTSGFFTVSFGRYVNDYMLLMLKIP